jgi:hypothetical protein
LSEMLWLIGGYNIKPIAGYCIYKVALSKPFAAFGGLPMSEVWNGRQPQAADHSTPHS